MVFHIEKFEAQIPADLLEKHFKGYKSQDESIVDQRITESWRGFKNYYVIQYKPHLIMEENVENAI